MNCIINNKLYDNWASYFAANYEFPFKSITNTAEIASAIDDGLIDLAIEGNNKLITGLAALSDSGYLVFSSYYQKMAGSGRSLTPSLISEYAMVTILIIEVQEADRIL